jgi:hypothetical protein
MYTQNKIDAVNTLENYAHNLQQKLIEYVEANKPLSVKNSGVLFEKHAKVVRQLINEDKPERARAHVVEARLNSLVIHVDVNYKNGEFSVNYIKKTIYTNYPNDKAQPITLDQYQAAKQKVLAINEQISKLKSEAQELEYKMYLR